MNKRPGLFFLFLFSLSILWAQTSVIDPSGTSTQFDMSPFPQWAKELRRAEIIAFGSFPFMYFFANFGMDTYRWIRYGGFNWGEGRQYAPWPINSAGSKDKTDSEKIATIAIAAGGSVLIALIDFGIERHKRKVKERAYLEYPEGTPIIIRKPINPEEVQSAETGNP